MLKSWYVGLFAPGPSMLELGVLQSKDWIEEVVRDVNWGWCPPSHQHLGSGTSYPLHTDWHLGWWDLYGKEDVVPAISWVYFHPPLSVFRNKSFTGRKVWHLKLYYPPESINTRESSGVRCIFETCWLVLPEGSVYISAKSTTLPCASVFRTKSPLEKLTTLVRLDDIGDPIELSDSRVRSRIPMGEIQVISKD